MTYMFSDIFDCVVNVLPDGIAIAGSEDSREKLNDHYSDIVMSKDLTDNSRAVLYLLCGERRVVKNLFSADTLMIDNARARGNRIDFTIIAKMKPMGYKQFDFDNGNILIFTKDKDLQQALGRRPFEYTKKIKPEPVPAPKPFTYNKLGFTLNAPKPTGEKDED